MNRAIWLGFMFFVALVLLGFGTLLVINLNPFAKTQNLQVYFDHVQGLRKGDMVRVDGVMLGKVEEIALRRESGVLVMLGLASPIALFSDAEILVESSSILGGSFVSIRRGNQPPEIDLREPLAGKNRLGLEQLGDLASENRENLKQLIANLKEVTQTLRDGQGSLGKLLRTDTLHKEAVETLQGVREDARRIGDTLNQNVTKLTDKLTEKMDKAEGPVGALLNDKKMTEQLTRTMDNVEETSKNLKAITDSVKKGEGALGKLVTDHEMGDKLKTTIDNIEKSSASIRNITGKLESGEGAVGKLLQEDELYEQARRTLDDIDRTLGKAARTVVEVVGDTRSYSDTKAHITKLGIRVTPSEGKYFQLSAAFLSLSEEGEILFEKFVEEGESDTLIKADIQVGYQIPWFLDRRLTVHAGVIEGRPGGGTDLLWENWIFFTYPVQFSFEIRDAYNSVKDDDIDEGIDGPLLRFTAEFPLWIRKENWFELLASTLHLYVGASRIGEDPEAMIGIGFKWPDDDIRTLVSLVSIAR